MIFNKKKGYQSLLIVLLSLSWQVALAASNSPLDTLISNESSLCNTGANIVPCIPIACTVDALNEAIAAANNNTTSTGSGIVILPANCVYLIENPAALTTGLPEITGNVTIVGGPGTIIARSLTAPDFRIFHVNTSATLKLQNLEVRDGSTGFNGSGGGIFDEGTLVLQNVILSHNNAGESGGGLELAVGARATVLGSSFLFNTTDGAGDPSGGAIVNRGVLIIKNTYFISNTAATQGGAIGAILDSTTNIIDSEFAFNTAQVGGAIINGGTMYIDHSIIHFNTATLTGGGIANDGTITLNNTAVVSNDPNNCSPLGSINGCVD